MYRQLAHGRFLAGLLVVNHCQILTVFTLEVITYYALDFLNCFHNSLIRTGAFSFEKIHPINVLCYMVPETTRIKLLWKEIVFHFWIHVDIQSLRIAVSCNAGVFWRASTIFSSERHLVFNLTRGLGIHVLDKEGS